MFNNAKAKLEECGVILVQMRAVNDAPSFRTYFNSFLSTARAVTNSLQKDGKHVTGFNQWYEAKSE